MPNSSEAVPFRMNVARDGRNGNFEAILTVTHSTNWQNKPGWKAVARMLEEDTRQFGTWRLSMVEAVRSLLETLSPRIEACERDRLVQVALDMQTRRTAILRTDFGNHMVIDVEREGAQVGSRHREDVLAPSQAHRLGSGVRAVHQMYGVFGDDKPMNSLFETSRKGWKDVARSMSARYHLWNAHELEALVKQKYPQYWDMYRSVRYPIMRCDIGRLLILHAFGGLYADLDILPNRGWYEQADLALARVKDPKKTGQSAKGKYQMAKGPEAMNPFFYLEMEVIVGTRGNDIFLRWVDHIATEIANKPYAETNSFWRNARMRYVYNTTGPMSMHRFLRESENAPMLKNLKALECNHFKDALKLSAAEKRCFDVLSYESNSYFTKEHEIHVPVGEGDMQIPEFGRSRRLQSKTPAAEAIVQETKHAEVNEM